MGKIRHISGLGFLTGTLGTLETIGDFSRLPNLRGLPSLPVGAMMPGPLWRLQPPNSAKATICITKTTLTIANVRYTSPREDGSIFIGQPPVRCRENHFRKQNLKLILTRQAKVHHTVWAHSC